MSKANIVVSEPGDTQVVVAEDPGSTLVQVGSGPGAHVEVEATKPAQIETSTAAAAEVTSTSATIGVVQQFVGPMGPPGPSGADLSTYTHIQDVPAADWHIHHGLGRRPAVTVTDSAGRWVITAVHYLDDDSLVIENGAPFAGRADLR